MAQTPALMQRARERAPQAEGYKKPDIAQFIPPEQKDAVDRVVAAGQKVMYSPDMREQLLEEVKRDAPIPQKLAEGVVGLLLTLDKQSNGGIPVAALFPAAMELLGEAAETLGAAGQKVTQEDYNQAAQMMFVLLGRKLGASDEQIMQGAEQAMGGQGAAPAEPDQAEPDAAEPPMPDEPADPEAMQ
jgi:hypothetical protein